MQTAQTELKNQAQPPSSGDQLLAGILANLHEAYAEGRAEVPLAALCKRLQVRMSTLQRHLSVLQEHALLESRCDAAGRWTCKLTEPGISWYTSVIAALPQNG